KPAPRVWFGGSHPNAVRRAVRLGDGFLGAGSQTTSQFADQVRVAREALADAGRDPAGFPIAKRVYLGIDDDGERARERVAAKLGARYGGSGTGGRLESVAVAGTPDEVVLGLREVVEAGAGLVLLNAMFDLPEQMERLAAEVVP